MESNRLHASGFCDDFPRKLKELVAACVESETFEYGEDSEEAAATQLRKDFDSGLSIYDINNNLRFGIITAAEDGEM